ncbi:MAG: PucR family transcriptional regulator [Jatrophihabitans sp.]|uniref:PucR family transcriptional regulator n=1 Tax=Jatrophihabitans sp. TaxID=1932789 RepID=UPI003F7F8FA4
MTETTVHPAVRSLAEALLDELPVLTAGMAEAIRTGDPVYADVPDLEQSCADHLSYVLGELAGLPRDTKSARRVGRRRAEAGVPLATVLRGSRRAARYILDVLLHHGGSTMSKTVLMSTAATAWEIFEEYSEALSSAYVSSAGERLRRDTETRAATAGALLTGELDADRLREAATALRLPLTGPFVVVVADGADSPAPRFSRRRVAAAWQPGVDLHTGVVVPPHHDLDLVTDLLDGLRAGVSAPFADLADAAPAAAEARLAWRIAAPGTVVRRDRAPLLRLLADAPSAAAYRDEVLGGLLALPDRERAPLLDTVRVWFDTGGSAAQTAAALFVHRNTVGYRVQQLERLSGRNLTHAAQAAELHVALTAHRLLTP